MTRVIGIFSSKGGVGKTTLSINLAASASYNFGKKVCLIDTNLSCASLGVHLGMHLNPTNFNMILREEAGIDDVLVRHPSGMMVLPASIQLKESLTQLSNLSKVISSLKKDYDLIFLDTAPSVDNETQWAMHSCDEGIIVTDPTTPSIIEAIKISKLAEKYRVRILGVVINKNLKNGLSEEEVSYFTRQRVLGKIPFDMRVDDSIKYHMPAVHYAPRSRLSQEIKKLSASLLGAEYRVPAFEKMLNAIGIN